MSSRASLLTALLIATAALVVFALPRAFAAEDSALLDQETRQGEVGAMSSQGAADFRAIAEEMEMNFGGDKARAWEQSSAVLGAITDKDVPAAIDGIRRMRTASGGDRRTEGQAVLRSQDAILAKIRTIMDSSVTGIASDTLSQRAEALIEAQKETEAQSKAIGAKTLGLSASNLPAESKAEIDSLSSRQDNLIRDAAALEQAASQAASSADAATKDSARRALDEGHLAKGRAAMEQAARAIRENRLGQATASQEEAVSELDAFRKSLEGASAAPAPDAELARLAADQRALSDETGRLGAGDAAGMAARQDKLAGDADKVTAAIADNPLASSYVEAASKEMATAAKALADSAGKSDAEKSAQVAKAAAGQKKALQHLEGAQNAMSDKEMSQAFKDLENKADETAQSADQVAALDDLMTEERDLKTQTDSAKDPKELRKQAPRQEDIRKRAEKLSEAAKQAQKANPPASSQARQGESRSGNSAAADADMEKALGAMSQAGSSLQNAQQQDAANGEQQALNSMGSARQKQAQQLSQNAEQLAAAAQKASQAASGKDVPPGMQSLMQQAGQMSTAIERARQAESLAGEERKLAAGTKALSPGMAAQMQGAASQQENISGRAQTLAAGAKEGEPFAQSLSDAGKEMDEATANLRGGNPVTAAGRQSNAARLLSQAAGRSLAAARQARARSTAGAKGISRAYPGTPGAIGVSPGGEAWISTLPPTTPPDVLQAAGGAFPRGYEETLRKYYESVAKTEARK